MQIPRIYTEQNLSLHSETKLNQSASRHLSKTLRLKINAPIILFNGQGGEYKAEITMISKNSVTARLDQFSEIDNESALDIHLGICVSRGERMDLIIQKSTELGVTEITPLIGERTEVKLNAERQQKRLNHWQQIAISACEQSGRNRVPAINDLQKPTDWVGTIKSETKLVLHHRNANSLKIISPTNSVALLMGPEGGLSEAEIENVESSHFQSLALGPRVLRTETAPLAAISMLQAFWGDMA